VLKKITAFVISAYMPTIAVLLIGCNESYTPQITGVEPRLHGSKKVPSYKTYPKQTYQKHTYQIPERPKIYKPKVSNPQWLPPAHCERRWKAVVIHHSATEVGSVESIDNYHKNHNGWDGIGYDFVIGNGSGCQNGQVESTFRWAQQRTGAHCKTDSSNWANEKAIGICLIGNFNKTKPSSRQLSSLLKLVQFLSERYDIPVSRIYGHSTTPGHSTITDCPGKKFPMRYVKQNL
jgi:hypothetical protein